MKFTLTYSIFEMRDSGKQFQGKKKSDGHQASVQQLHEICRKINRHLCNVFYSRCFSANQRAFLPLCFNVRVRGWRMLSRLLSDSSYWLSDSHCCGFHHLLLPCVFFFYLLPRRRHGRLGQRREHPRKTFFSLLHSKKESFTTSVCPCQEKRVTRP